MEKKMSLMQSLLSKIQSSNPNPANPYPNPYVNHYPNPYVNPSYNTYANPSPNPYVNPNPNPNPYTNPTPNYQNTVIPCSRCRTQLSVPVGVQSIRCAVCQKITRVPNHNPNPNPNPSPSPSLYSSGRKRAVVCGIAYRGSRYELKGTLNDANCIKFLLIKRFSFPESSICMLTENERDRFKLPTKQNIMMALQWLIQGCQPGDSLVFYYSGHGSQRRNRDGSEVDGLDETILPMDFQMQGMIVDDDINATIVRPLPLGVRLHAIVDSCHSGTALDLPFLLRQSQGQYVWEDHRPRNGVYKGTSGGEAFCFSGCDDNQTSADTSALSQVTYTGAMTFSFIQAIERNQARTYKDLLQAMRYYVQSAGSNSGSGGSITSLVQMLLSGGRTYGHKVQEPQLTASSPFDINKAFTL